MSRPSPTVDIATFLDTGFAIASATNDAAGARTFTTATPHGLAPGASFRARNTGVASGVATVDTAPTATTLVTVETYADAASITGGRLYPEPAGADARVIGVNLFWGRLEPADEGEAVEDGFPDESIVVMASGGPPVQGTHNRGAAVFAVEFTARIRSARISGDEDRFAQNEARAVVVLDHVWQGKPTGYLRTSSFQSHPEYAGTDGSDREIHTVRGTALFSHTTP